MRKTTCLTVAAALGWFGVTEPLTAQKVNNGFPSGPHYNLNIISKKEGYNCVPLEFDEFGDPIYGNVVFIPESGNGIEILMTSGKKGGRQGGVTELRVIDACAGFDGDAAEIQLPPNDNGYRVYARALGKPSEDNELSMSPHLVLVEDEHGNLLLDLGLVSGSKVFKSGEETFTRRKGKSTAVDITDLFRWSGTVCTIDWDFDPELGEPADTALLCWLDSQTEGEDGFGLLDPADGFFAPLDDGSCAEGEGVPVEVPLLCNTFEEAWIFNIGDLVTYLWDVNNNKVKLLQVRFYPN